LANKEKVAKMAEQNEMLRSNSNSRLFNIQNPVATSSCGMQRHSASLGRATRRFLQMIDVIMTGTAFIGNRGKTRILCND